MAAMATGKKGKTIIGTVRSDTLSGTANDDHIFGLAGNDRLYGGNGDDVLDGGSGDDKLFGEDGCDKLTGGEGADQLTGGAGNDTLVVDLFDTKVAGGTGIDHVILTGADGFQDYGGKTTQWTGIETISGTAFSDRVDFSSFQTGLTIDGGSGDDIVFTGAGNDVVKGGEGSDYISTGGGDDLITVSADDQYVDAGQGYDRVVLTGAPDTSGRLTFISSLFLGVEKVTGTAFNDTIELLGLADAVVVNAGAGADVIYGGLGADSLFGGAGNDLLFAGFEDAVVSGGDGMDRVGVYSPYDGASQQLIANGNWNSIEGILGTAYADYIDLRALKSDVFIEAGTGDDIVYGGSRSDTALLGEGADTLYGGKGLDTAIFTGNAADYRFDNSKGWFEVSDQRPVGTGVSSDGTDALYDVEVYRFADGDYSLNQLLALPIFGTEAADTIVGSLTDNTIDARGGDDYVAAGSGNDIVRGGAGNDTIYGEDGNDILSGNEGDDRLDGSDGVDTAVFTGTTSDYRIDTSKGWLEITDFGPAGSSTLRDGTDALYNIELFQFADGTYSLTELLALPIYGSDTADTISGSEADNTIYALGGNDTVFGNGGNDTIYGGAGEDMMFGGAGDDTFYTDTSDRVIYGDSGFDRIFLTVTTGGTIGIDTGSSIEEVHGNAGNDIIAAEYSSTSIVAFGGDGNDTLAMGSGSDTLDGGNGDDVLFGGLGSDVLLGGEGGDYLNGGAGDDYLYGGNGIATLIGGSGSDQFAFKAGDQGTSEIQDFTLGNDKINLTGMGLTYNDLVIADYGSQVMIGLGAAFTYIVVVWNQTAASFTEDQFLF
jgi:Ca2+-binding RTX toxin-like protein